MGLPLLRVLGYHCQVILGADYDTSADMWSLACIVFELLTGDLLFDPRAGRLKLCPHLIIFKLRSHAP